MCREITYEEFKPLRVEMTRPAPPCAKQLAKYFLCPVRYGAERTCIAFRRDQTEKFLPRQNPALARANDEVALRYIAQMDRSDVLSRSKLAMMDMLSNGEPSRKALAERLHMSERTLARRLRDRGVSFRGLLDGVRKELGLGYMDELRHAVTDVAYLLGFSDQSNFARSFRRWTGLTPSQYRAEQEGSFRTQTERAPGEHRALTASSDGCVRARSARIEFAANLRTDRRYVRWLRRPRMGLVSALVTRTAGHSAGVHPMTARKQKRPRIRSRCTAREVPAGTRQAAARRRQRPVS